MSNTEMHLPIAPPAVPSDYKKVELLKPEHEEMYKKVLAHFSEAEYTIPSMEKGLLTDEEKFWLVSSDLKDAR